MLRVAHLGIYLSNNRAYDHTGLACISVWNDHYIYMVLCINKGVALAPVSLWISDDGNIKVCRLRIGCRVAESVYIPHPYMQQQRPYNKPKQHTRKKYQYELVPIRRGSLWRWSALAAALVTRARRYLLVVVCVYVGLVLQARWALLVLVALSG